MFDWKTGEGNARANVLKLLLKNFAVGTTFFETSITPVRQCWLLIYCVFVAVIVVVVETNETLQNTLQ